MSKYEPLSAFLKGQARDFVPMTFSEIERVLSDKLPPSKAHRAWWSNNPSNNVMTKEWLSAGYETESVDVAGEKLVFRKVKKTSTSNSAPSPPAKGDKPGERRPLHPGFGFLKGMIKIEPGFDITGPFSDESWEDGYLGEDRLMEGKIKAQRK